MKYFNIKDKDALGQSIAELLVITVSLAFIATSFASLLNLANQ